MAFNQIDGPGPRNRAERRAVAAIQRLHGAEARKAQAKAKRDAKAGKRIAQDLARTIVFYAMPPDGVRLESEDGVYIHRSTQNDGKWQAVIVGTMRASIDHYVKAISTFLNQEITVISDEPLPIVPAVETSKTFRSLIVQVVHVLGEKT